MPLIVPDLQNLGQKDINLNMWKAELGGKKIGDSTDGNVGPELAAHIESVSDKIKTFAKDKLPQKHRIYVEGSPISFDHIPDRLNVVTDNKGVVQKDKVHYG